MGDRAGLVQKKVRVKTKRGVAMRTMWVKSSPDKAGMKVRKGSVLGFVQKHKGKIAGAAALAAGAYLAHKHGKGIAGALGGARLGRSMVNEHASSMGGKASLKHQALGMLHGATQGLRNHHGDSQTGTRVANAAKNGAGRVLAGAKFAGQIARHPIQAAKGVRDFARGGQRAVAEFKAKRR